MYYFFIFAEHDRRGCGQVLGEVPIRRIHLRRTEAQHIPVWNIHLDVSISTPTCADIETSARRCSKRQNVSVLILSFTHRKYAPDGEGGEDTKKPKRLILQIGDLFGSSGCSFIERSMTDYNYVKRVTTKQARAFKKKETERGDSIEDDSDSEEEDNENDDGIDSDENGSEPDKQPTDVEKFM